MTLSLFPRGSPTNTVSLLFAFIYVRVQQSLYKSLCLCLNLTVVGGSKFALVVVECAVQGGGLYTLGGTGHQYCGRGMR